MIDRCPLCRAFSVDCDGMSHRCSTGHEFPVHPSSKEARNGSQQVIVQEDLNRAFEQALDEANHRHPSNHVIDPQGHLLQGPDFDELVRRVDRGASPSPNVGSRRITAGVPRSPRGLQGSQPTAGTRAPTPCSRGRRQEVIEAVKCDTPWAMLALTIVMLIAAWLTW